MIERLRLKGFQCHKSLTIDFDQIVVLAGKSDVGKSAIIRALKWLALNRPNGDAFVNHDSEFAKVELEVDGRRIVRSKGKENTYRLDDKKYIAFGSDVPEEIRDALNIAPENISGQHDPPFLLSSSPGDVAKCLNDVVNLGLIDRTLAKLSTEARKARMVAELCKERLDDARGKRDGLSWTEDADIDLRKLESLEKEIDKTRSEEEELRVILEEIHQDQQRRKTEDQFIEEGERLLSIADEAGQVFEKRDELQVLVEKARKNEKELNKLDRMIGNLTRQLDDLVGEICPLCKQPTQKKLSA